MVTARGRLVTLLTGVRVLNVKAQSKSKREPTKKTETIHFQGQFLLVLHRVM